MDQATRLFIAKALVKAAKKLEGAAKHEFSSDAAKNDFDALKSALSTTRATKVLPSKEGGNDVIRVRYHNTDVVTLTYSRSLVSHAVLDSGGYNSATTKDRMNTVLGLVFRPHGIQVSVYQKAGAWFVRAKGTDHPYKDGMDVTELL